MLNSLLIKLNNICYRPIFWLGIFLSSLALILVALFYQHVLEEWPCVICIQIRLWVSLLGLVALLAWLFSQYRQRYRLLEGLSRLLLILVGVGLTERSYQLLGTERGFVFSDCGFSTGLPGWLAFEQWMPWLYRVDASCGYTPELWLGITMAEALMVMSLMLLVFSFLCCLALLMVRQGRPE